MWRVVYIVVMWRVALDSHLRQFFFLPLFLPSAVVYFVYVWLGTHTIIFCILLVGHILTEIPVCLSGQVLPFCIDEPAQILSWCLWHCVSAFLFPEK